MWRWNARDFRWSVFDFQRFLWFSQHILSSKLRTGWMSGINCLDLSTQPIQEKVDWLIVESQSSSSSLLPFHFPSPRHNLSSLWRTGWLSRVFSLCSFFTIFFALFATSIDTNYPLSGGLADCRGIIFRIEDWMNVRNQWFYLSTQPIQEIVAWLIVNWNKYIYFGAFNSIC